MHMTKPATSADLILHHGMFTTLARAQPTASAVAIRDGRFLAVGADKEVLALAGPKTRVVDLEGRRVLPGLIDSHLHIIRGGLPPHPAPPCDPMRTPPPALG